jgi:NAD(P)H-hydrate epimerase
LVRIHAGFGGRIAMNVLPPSVMQAWEKKAFEGGLGQAELMRTAVEACWQELRRRFGEPRPVLVLAGKGNNGNDALTLGARLRDLGWPVTVVLSDGVMQRSRSPLAEGDELARGGLVWPARPAGPLPARLLILDGLLGVGAKGLARGAARDILLWIAHERRAGNVAISLDVPSGLDLETGEQDAATFHADFTFCLGAIKPMLLSDSVSRSVGRLVGLPLPALGKTSVPDHQKCDERWFDLEEARSLARSGSVQAHKHQRGNLGILAGSPGMAGAAVLAANAAVVAGAGLVRLWSRLPENYVYPGLCPEVMRAPSWEALLESGCRAYVVGPGLGHDAEAADILSKFLANVSVPVVLDADALNLLAVHPELWQKVSFPFVLTPHTGELERLTGRLFKERKEAALMANEKFHGTLVVKGPYTLVAGQESGLTWNGSGNPGMASGGMGDVLSGIIGTLLAQGYPPVEAARLGVFWHGLAGDQAAGEFREQVVHATMVTGRLPAAARAIWNF